jgi:hypothetical protein
MSLPVEIEGVARWRATSDVASRYQDGRIFLAGDCAHLMPPNGGYGGNTGIHDAHNLAWKLAYVLDGKAGPALLDSYQVERRPVGRFTVDQAFARYVARTAPHLKDRDVPPYVDDFQIELGYLYDSAAVAAEPGAPKGREDPHQSFGRPGSRAPHVWIEHGGRRISTVDLYGDGFALLTGPQGSAWRDAAKGLDVRVETVADPAFAKAYGLQPSGASLVRPDGFVAWRSQSAPDRAKLASTLDTILART